MNHTETELAAAMTAAGIPSDLHGKILAHGQAVAEGAIENFRTSRLLQEHELVKSFAQWRAARRVIRRGEKALAFVTTPFERRIRDTSSGEEKTIKMMARTALFHISQTKPMRG